MSCKSIMMLALIAAATEVVSPAQESVATTADSEAATARYVIGPGDHIRIWALGLEDVFDKTFIVEPEGYIQVPLAGSIRINGLTTADVQSMLVTRLCSELRDPQVTVTIVEFKSRPVSVLGAVNTPGIHYVQGAKTLTQVLAMAGGLRQDAGHIIKITRKLPASASYGPADTSTDQFSITDVELKSLLAAEHPEQNITIRGDDVITVPRAELVYVIGEVAKAGGFPLNEREQMTTLQALSLAGGLMPTASKGDARILRSSPGESGRKEIPVDVGAILSGKLADVPLQSDDIFFIPGSVTRRVTAKMIEAAINIGTGVLIWR